ncbi:hypothetical protein [Tardiphaga sp.]|uniref:hypothetical protein n=1 Tax=Tardiphaga sp. TaxID=1926292 RepID=UPI002627CDD2|nr:hypothetical protein [Tardiphaga sp.]MDB5616718.1 hypothetical protein [Tardiphaga sp.]
MNGLANWNRLSKGLGICFVIAFLTELWWAQTNIALPSRELSWNTIHALYGAFGGLSEAAGGALAITGAVFWLFTKWGWRQPVFQKLGLINFPDLSGTWHAISNPGEWNPFRTVVVINHSFHGLRMTLIRTQSTGNTLAATLARTNSMSARLYVTYYSSFGKERTLPVIPAVDHGEDHSGALLLDLNDESLDPEAWVLRGEYWTNKRRDASDDRTRGTWGRIEMRFQRREPAPSNIGHLRLEDATWLIDEPTPDNPRAQPAGASP